VGDAPRPSGARLGNMDLDRRRIHTSHAPTWTCSISHAQGPRFLDGRAGPGAAVTAGTHTHIHTYVHTHKHEHTHTQANRIPSLRGWILPFALWTPRPPGRIWRTHHRRLRRHHQHRHRRRHRRHRRHRRLRLHRRYRDAGCRRRGRCLGAVWMEADTCVVGKRAPAAGIILRHFSLSLSHCNAHCE
jgi:hypothetical protein